MAFVLAVGAPVLGRLPARGRWAATLGLLGFFALVTRFEPSVLRATAMAGLATTASMVGRPASSIRLLALAVAGLVLLDPFLVRSVGFGLSIGASAGIVLLSGPLAAWLPGPEVVVRPLSVTLSAQAGVAPLLVPVFGGIPVASVPANLLAEPAAGLVMVWGLTGGVLAGVTGGPVATLLHLPTRVVLWWVATVARVAADLPLGELQLLHVAVLGTTVAAVVVVRRRGRRVAGAVLTGAALIVAAAPTWQLALDPPFEADLDGNGRLFRDGAARVLVLQDDPDPARLLRAVRRRGIDEVDLVVSPSGAPADGTALAILRRRVAIGAVWAPTGHEIAYAVTPPAGRYELGDLSLEVSSSQEALDVTIARRGSPGRDAGAGV